MPKGRIGLSLSEDVLAILNECGRNDRLPGWVTLGRIKVDIENETETFEGVDQSAEYLARPTRTQIIEEAVRQWATRQGARTNGARK